ncbi:MAG: hypothetical protein ACLPVY_15525 [Acidimicrobiia bacterium]
MSGIRIRPLTLLLVVLALALIAVGVVYVTTTAGDLPTFFLGHAARSTKHHYKHALVAFTLAIVALVGAWFSTAPDAPSAAN